MELSIDVGTWILDTIQKKGLTKSLVYQGAGITQSGFLKMIKNNSLRLDTFINICEAMAVNPIEYFQKAIPKVYKPLELDNSVGEPGLSYERIERKRELEFARKEIEYLKRENELLNELVNALRKN